MLLLDPPYYSLFQYLILSIILFEILCYLTMRWIDSAFFIPFSRRVLKRALPVIEDEVNILENINCPRFRLQAAKYNTKSIFDNMSKKFTEQNKRLERAAASGSMSSDLESQELVFQRPTPNPHDRQIYANLGYWSCHCEHDDYTACENYKPVVVGKDDSLPDFPPMQRDYEPCSWSCLEEDVIVWKNRLQEAYRRAQNDT